MSFNFPSPATVGQLYPDPPWEGAPQYKWDGIAWVAQAVAGAAEYVKKVGDTMTGALTAPAYNAPLSSDTILGDITVARAVASGVVHFGSSKSAYVYYTGGQFVFAGGNLNTSGLAPTDVNHLVNKTYADTKAANVGTSQFNSTHVTRSGTTGVAHFEFGHNNPLGYGSTLGCESSTGYPFLGFFCGPGSTTVNTYKTLGIKGSVIKADSIGGFTFSKVDNANADNQNLTLLMSLSNVGAMTLVGGLEVGNSEIVYNGLHVRTSVATPTTGTLYFGNAGTKYLSFDGTAFNFGGGPVNMVGSGRLSVGSSGSGFWYDAAVASRFFVGSDVATDAWRIYTTGYGNAFSVTGAGDVTIAVSLTIPNAPTAGGHAANKTYVDTKLPLAGGTITGALTVNSTLQTVGNLWAHGGVCYLSNTGGHYIQQSGGVYNVGGQTIYHTGNFNPASYLPVGGGTIGGTLSCPGLATTMTYGAAAGYLEVKGAGGGADAMMTFHRPSSFACNFGLSAGGANANHFAYGGYSHGGNQYNVFSNAGSLMSLMMHEIAGGLSAAKVPKSRSSLRSMRDELRDLLLLAAEHFDEKAEIEKKQWRLPNA